MIRGYQSVEATKTLVSFLVLSRLDYCDAVLSMSSVQTAKSLNTAAPMIFKAPRTDHITPI